ncbi:para-nitrobenzyl esterase [Draconibacterium orientale]|uniref:Carboxylic ester hydrolase n=1 Tax=Draconibacterium orientale TaxID=1168034 RepID=X5DC82_9BACT|nr:carboxylesterase/lipase family protein [Draconibacterium orientale]AHW58569.1 carboxylesterase [Draconibacterium orientale]SEU13147.1 para-nitrobenzyl esterase [Draconibacterium orientale]
MKSIKLTILIFLVLNFGACTTTKDNVQATFTCHEIVTSATSTVVSTEAGEVAGYIEDGIYIYKGIPYAEADRFMPPHSPARWEGVRSSRAYGPVCPQEKRMGWYSDEQAFAFDWDDGYADENCLRVNIWTQGINDKKKRPVMVWLHGGGYSAGSGQELPAYDGAALCKKGDVVLVSLNHRLNVLGFLDLSAFGEKYAKSGNVGLLDLVEALKWIKNNIEQFGGDPQNVTIFGQSGGGGKVSTLMATPAAAGLFDKAIVQSGSLLNSMEARYSRKIGLATLQELGLKASQIDELAKLPYEKLLEAGNKAVSKVREEAGTEGLDALLFGWEPTVDGNVLPWQPADIKALEQSKNIPLLVGTTLHEFTATTYNPAWRTIDKTGAINILEQRYGEKTHEFLSVFEKAYPNYQAKDLLDVDFLFRPKAVEQASLKYNIQGAPVYSYLFTWESPVLDGMFRSTHCMELPFVFNNISRCRKMTGGGEEALKLADKMSLAWINFAKTGNPNTNNLPEWKPYTPDNGATMLFNNKCELKYKHDKELIELVNSFHYQLLAQ